MIIDTGSKELEFSVLGCNLGFFVGKRGFVFFFWGLYIFRFLVFF